MAAATLTASRVQLAHGGPGVLTATVPIPAVLIIVVAFLAARWARSFRFGLETGLLAIVGSLAAMAGVLAVDGERWMRRLGVYMLDADPPRTPPGTLDVALDLFSTGMWIGHVAFWVPAVLVGAWAGACASRTAPPTAPAAPS